jgi:sterol desaturase/sphingolipid hydroxylase (fatty acid hydroxylase superfamily)
MGRIAGLLVGLGLLSVFFWIVEWLFRARPQPAAYRRPGFRTDLVYWFATPLVTRSISQVGLALILILLYRRNVGDLQTMLAARDTLLARQNAVVEAIEMLVLGDFIAYWLHRWFHGNRMWKYHAVHHSSRQLDWLSSVRVHPVNGWVTRWIQATILVVLGFSPGVVAAYVPFLTLYAVFLHANVAWGFGRLGRIVASPRFHRWHHTSEELGLNRNFSGLFPFWDVLFGTFFMPPGEQPSSFGLNGEAVPETYFGQLLYPFRKPPLAAD